MTIGHQWVIEVSDEVKVSDCCAAGTCGSNAIPFVRPESKLGRNDPCRCGSGKKLKEVLWVSVCFGCGTCSALFWRTLPLLMLLAVFGIATLGGAKPY